MGGPGSSRRKPDHLDNSASLRSARTARTARDNELVHAGRRIREMSADELQIVTELEQARRTVTDLERQLRELREVKCKLIAGVALNLGLADDRHRITGGAQLLDSGQPQKNYYVNYA